MRLFHLTRSLQKVLLARVFKMPAGATRIGTHNGTFHCDEVLACYMLKQLPEFKNAEIIRTRDPQVLEECDILVDVGGVYNPATHRYDHHQRSFTETMQSLQPYKRWATKLSSAGLVYVHFGRQVISQIIGLKEESNMTEIIYDKVYEHFIEEVDAIDNGVNIAEGNLRYTISTNLSSRVGHLNPTWNEQVPVEDIYDRFTAAMDLVGKELRDRVHYYHSSWWPARSMVAKALEARFEVDGSGAILHLEEGGCPWKEHLFLLEHEMGLGPISKFILYKDQCENWRVQCVPKDLKAFSNRLSLLEQWQGLRDEELSKLSGISGCVFVHSSGFIGGNKTYQGALEMAQKTLENASANE